MAKKATPEAKPTKQWMEKTYSDVAAFFGVSLDTVRVWRKYGMPGQRGYYDLSAIYKWLKSRADATARTDPLERQRDERAKILRLERLQKEGTLVTVASIQHVLTAFASRLGELGEHCRKEYGEGIVDLFNEKVGDAIRELGLAESDSENNPD